jgi:hypothetical protein
MKKFMVIPLLALFFPACSAFERKAELQRWEGQKMTLCCTYCNENGWKKSVGQHCQGNAIQIGGEKNKTITGYRTTSRKIHKDQEITETQADTRTEECRIYTCNGVVNPAEAE